jgi:hypothetical protein
MLIIGCDFHTRFQQMAMLDPATGEVIERRLEHQSGEASRFSASRATPSCATCGWKRPRPLRNSTRNCGGTISD